MTDDEEHQHATAVPEHRGVKRQMQGLAWLLPMLNRPEHQRAIDRIHVDAPIAQPTPAPPLPAGSQAAVERDGALPLVKANGLTEQQSGDHPAQQHQMAFVSDRTVLTEESDQLSMEPSVGFHEGLVWCQNPKLSWLPAHPMT